MVAAALVVWAAGAGCRSAGEPRAAVVVDPAAHEAVGRGPTRVIVELRIPGGFRPEGDLPDAAAVSAQRARIAAAQDRVVAGLAGTRATLARRFSSVPSLALEIDADALRALTHMPDVVERVVLDQLSAPSRP